MASRSRPSPFLLPLCVLPLCTALVLAGCGKDKKAADTTVAAASDSTAVLWRFTSAAKSAPLAAA